jgi:hypothetical protein
MFRYWKAKISTVGAFLLAVITWLAFFGIDARTLREQMTAHYLFLVAALVFTALFFIAARYWWKATRVTPENVHVKIREWLDAFNLSHSVMSWEPWHFRYDVMFRGQIIFVGRPKAGSGRYLHIELRTTGVLPQHAQSLMNLTPFERMRFEGSIALELARARVSFTRYNADYSDISITTTLPITAHLNEMDLISGLAEVFSGGMILWNATALQLDKKPELIPHALPDDTQASPPKPT